MATDPPRSFLRRALRFLLGTDQPVFMAAVACVALAFGHLVMFHAVYFGTREAPPLWQTIAGGTAMGLLLMPVIFICIARFVLTMSPWVALATLAAILPCPIALWRLGPMGAGLNGVLVFAGCAAFVLGVFFAARAIVRRQGS